MIGLVGNFLKECYKPLDLEIFWRKWITKYVATLMFLILVNGEAIGYFKS